MSRCVILIVVGVTTSTTPNLGRSNSIFSSGDDNDSLLYLVLLVKHWNSGGNIHMYISTPEMEMEMERAGAERLFERYYVSTYYYRFYCTYVQFYCRYVAVARETFLMIN